MCLSGEGVEGRVAFVVSDQQKAVILLLPYSEVQLARSTQLGDLSNRGRNNG